jgi:hypothetical protein
MMEGLEDAVEDALDLTAKNDGGKISPLPKPVRNIKAAEVTGKIYLETESDVDEYLGKLREKIIEAIKKDSKVRIV